MGTTLPPNISQEKLISIIRRDQGGPIIKDVEILSISSDEIRAVCSEYFKGEIESVNIVSYYLSPNHWKLIGSNQATENEKGFSIWYEEQSVITIETPDEAMKLAEFLQKTFTK